MIFELRTYTLYPGKLPEYLHLAKTIGRPVRGNDYGVCHAYWTSDYGMVDQVWHLWSFESLDDRTRQRAKLAKMNRWMVDYGGQVLPILQRQEIRFLNPVSSLNPPAPGGLFELRLNHMKPGCARPWLNAVFGKEGAGNAPAPHVGLWVGEAPQPNEVVELLAYPSPEDRTRYLGDRFENMPGNGDGEAASMLFETRAYLLRPTDFSPMQ